MGHLISSGFLSANSKEAALKEGLMMAEDFAYYNGDRREGSDTYHGNFRFYNEEFDDEDSALDFFRSLGDYTDGIVKVKCPSSASKKRYMDKVSRLEDKKKEYLQRLLNDFKQRKSATVGCKKCGNRIASEEAVKRRLVCPKCRTLLIPNGAKNRLEQYDQKIEDAFLQYKKDTSQSGVPRYYAKFEVSC